MTKRSADAQAREGRILSHSGPPLSPALPSRTRQSACEGDDIAAAQLSQVPDIAYSGLSVAVGGRDVIQQDHRSLNGGDDVMQKSLHIDPGKCTGCLQCEMACSYENTGMFNPSKSRIKVFDFHHEGRKVPYTCTQCAEAWCLNACPVEAIKIDAGTGAKVVLDASLRGLQGVHDRLSVRDDQLQP
jgi:NAD-dependent dihydropyrimidine dehydrogenase PreA subunit